MGWFLTLCLTIGYSFYILKRNYPDRHNYILAATSVIGVFLLILLFAIGVFAVLLVLIYELISRLIIKYSQIKTRFDKYVRKTI